MRCEFCGEEITPGALACPRCGAPVSKPAGAGGAGEQSAQPRQAAEPGAGLFAEKPPEPPLAKLEEDFIAMAEESVPFEDTEPPGVDAPQGAPPTAEAASVAAIADQQVPPGATVAPEQVVLDNSMISGYKGPETSSVAGAGEQTADDPFGLNITETAPPSGQDTWSPLPRSWRFSGWWNMTVMIVGAVVLVAGLGAGIYFGFIRKAGPDAGAPLEAVRDYLVFAVSGDETTMSRFAAPGSSLKDSVHTLLKGYEKYGVMAVKGFSGKTVKISGDSATVKIEKLEVELQDEKGDKEVISVLDITKPFELPTTIEVIKIDEEWKVKT